MAAPTTLEELNAAVIANTTITGLGAETATVTACPFCGAAGFMTLPITGVREALAAGATCAACGRAGKFAFSGPVAPMIEFKFVQTGGIDPPAFMVPMPERVSP